MFLRSDDIIEWNSYSVSKAEKGMSCQILLGDCTEILKNLSAMVDLTFLDPPFNQGKEYENHNDNLPDRIYWEWMEEVCKEVYWRTSLGGAIYFMQREKNTEQVLACLRKAGWN